ncbi:Isopentenyl phosphate kinase [Dissostichus eleginoides]|uniref:Isopentenyl phosphate kinase n=1 Tax=Dissostichus eleginoides TaxID=100907 RepID=A0AAD9ESS8_DISEL|nr:Isopentenyl phosphate kinase [Dissostichus eleginoides]
MGFHFGGSRQQATIHTSVLYTVHGIKSYATLSDSLRHDERAVWAHLEPILRELRETFPQITSLHILSDGPVTQYRNKNNFYLLSTVPFLSGFTNVTWNYSEKSHGKGAPDGIGGAIKREADLYVHRGGELQTPQDLYEMLNKRLGSSITYYWVSRESIESCDELIPGSLQAVKGTFKIHQVVSSQPAKITHREVSCFCKRLEMSPCPCYKPVTVDLRNTVHHTENQPRSLPEPPREQESVLDLCGKFVIVPYDELPYVGQVLKVVGEELQVSCMRQSGDKNLFMWPQTPDVIFYFRKDIHAAISDPEPATSRFSKLTCQDWVKFRNTWV